MWLEGEKVLWSSDKNAVGKKIAKLVNVVGYEVQTVVVTVGQWRKNNAVHKWFVNNVQEGNDDCKRYYVSTEDLKLLRKICHKILKTNKKDKGHVAKELLPTQGGFFFGETSYDEYYYDCLKETIEIVNKALKLDESWDLYYQASW